MITLPVTAQMYHQLVQQQMPNSDNTVCVTPMQVQNFITNSNLCSGNSTTAYLTAAAAATNRNIINLPQYATQNCPIVKTTVLANPSTSKNNTASQTLVKKSLFKKKILKLAVAKQKQNHRKVIINNNMESVKNKNQQKSPNESKVQQKKYIKIKNHIDDLKTKKDNSPIMEMKHE